MKTLIRFWQKNKATPFGTSTIQGVRFMTVGVINTLIDIIVYYVLTRYTTFFVEQITLTRILSFLFGSVCSFFLNRIWTFEKKDRVTTKEVGKFYITVGMSLLIGLVAMKLFIDVLHLYDLIALGLSIIFTFIWNFTISKFWVFKKILKV